MSESQLVTRLSDIYQRLRVLEVDLMDKAHEVDCAKVDDEHHWASERLYVAADAVKFAIGDVKRARRVVEGWGKEVSE